VRQILGGESFPFELQNQKIDLPELQGTPEDISKEKCRLAAKQVSMEIREEREREREGERRKRLQRLLPLKFSTFVSSPLLPLGFYRAV
jgi:hypothetical protein